MGNKIIIKLSILVPTYNEEKTIKFVINNILKLKLINWIDKEIIVINDWSNDNTKNIIDEFDWKIKIIHLKNNLGKWWAIIEGLKISTWDYLIIQDADLEYNPEDINLLLNRVILTWEKVLYWSRNLSKNKYNNIFFYIWWILITKFTNLLYNQDLTDEATWYKLIETNLLKTLWLESKWFDFCIETTIKISKLWYKIKELPISYNARSFKEWKKIRFKDGVITFYKIFKYFLWRK